MSRQQRLRQLGAILFSLGLVASMMTIGMAPSPVGTAEAASIPCIEQSLIVFTASLFCPESDETDTSQIDDNQTALDIYSAALSAEQSWSEFNTVMENRLLDTRTVAFAKAQAAAVEELDAGGTESEVKAAATAAVQDYYTRIEMNYVQAWETKSVTLGALSRRAQNESGVQSNLIYGSYGDVASGGLVTDDGVGSLSYSLLNGTSLTYQTVAVGISGSNYGLRITGGWYGFDQGTIQNGGPVSVKSIDSSHPGFEALNASTSSNFLSSLSSASTQIESNAEEMVNGTYDRFQNGTLNASEFISPLTLAQEYSQKYNETGYYAYATAVLASLGYSVPNLNETASMTVAYNGTNHTGLLMSQHAPSGGTWEVGQTYDTDLIEGVQMFASAENGTFEMDGTFEILSMQDVNGTEIQNTTTQTYVYENVTNTEYIERQENITELRINLEGMEPGGTGGGGLGGATGTGLAVAFLLGGAGVWYLNRE